MDSVCINFEDVCKSGEFIQFRIWMYVNSLGNKHENEITIWLLMAKIRKKSKFCQRIVKQSEKLTQMCETVIPIIVCNFTSAFGSLDTT